MAERRSNPLILRRRHTVQGIVQGVGFRPFVYRLAHELNLSGWVRNSPAGVELEIQGSVEALESFGHNLLSDIPPLAVINSSVVEDIPVNNDQGFTILSSVGGEPDIQIAPDSAVCQDCLNELFDPADRRYRYPFITCTNCGPRYSIITGIPYDRPNTTMSGFPLCTDCQREYLDPLDRRFHAQPIACHVCGPKVTLVAASGKRMAEGDGAVTLVVQLLKEGAVLAIKGIGGYHLAVDACSSDAVQRLRERKKRDEKPFAVMAADLAAARELAHLSDVEERLLCSPEAPIIIVRKRPDTLVSDLVAPGNGWLGLMLPYAPLQHLLFQGHGTEKQGQGSRVKGQKEAVDSSPCPLPLDPAFKALVMTSGNISDEPVAYEDADAFKRLSDIADYFLMHDRPIHIRSDDSVLRLFQGKPLFYRRARGYAPRAVSLPFVLPPLLAVGAELKSAICVAGGSRAFLSQHIGDLQNRSTFDSFGQTVTHLTKMLKIKPERIACDLHPDYLSSRFAEDSGLPLTKVQHHHAHFASCMAENALDGNLIGVIFDGTGYGSDGTIWGGEFLVGGYDGYRRAGHFRAVPLPGGDAAVQEPWRMALSYLYQLLGEEAFAVDQQVARILPEQDMALFRRMLTRGINSPLTSSCGRLFDAVAALLDLRHSVSYDGQGAIELEALAETADGASGTSYAYSILSIEEEPLQVDFSRMFAEILNDIAASAEASSIAWRFHHTVAAAAADACFRIAEATALDRVVLSGGVFQNRLLSEMVYTALTGKGMNVFTHRLVPPNDGGIALGQAVIAGRREV